MTDEAILTPTEARVVALFKAKPDARQEDLAAELKISARHLRRLLGHERVRKALDTAAREGLARASTLLGNGAQRAAQSLLAMAVGTLKATTPRVQAARAVLDGAGRLVDLVDLEARIKRLEAGTTPPGELQ